MLPQQIFVSDCLHFTLNVNCNFAAAKSGHVSIKFAPAKSGLVLLWLNFDASKKGFSSKPAPGKSGKVSSKFAAAIFVSG